MAELDFREQHTFRPEINENSALKATSSQYQLIDSQNPENMMKKIEKHRQQRQNKLENTKKQLQGMCFWSFANDIIDWLTDWLVVAKQLEQCTFEPEIHPPCRDSEKAPSIQGIQW